MKHKNIIIPILLSMVMIFLIVFLYIQIVDYISIIEKKEIYSRIIIGDKYGFDINGTALIFGMTPPGTGSIKEIFLDNKYGQDVKINIFVRGSIKKFMRVSENEFIVKENENKKIRFFVNTPKNTEYGTYEGTVIIVIRK